MQPHPPTRPKLLALWLVTALTACSVEAVTFRLPSVAIGGTITGLEGSGLVLTINGGDDLALSRGGAFAFATPIPSGATYDVRIAVQPSQPTQDCTVTNGAGTVDAADVTSIAINCTTNSYMVTGTVTGLVNSLILRNNGGDDLTIMSNGTFAFSTPVPSAGTYDVIVQRQPYTPWQTCTVAAGAGTVTNADVTSIAVTCTTNRYRIRGSSSGLASVNSVTLRNNGGDDVVATGPFGDFTFPTPIESGQMYNVTLVASPTSPVSQTCTLISNTGIVSGDDILGVRLLCTTNQFTLGGTVSGLTGAGLVLRSNFAGNVAITGNGAFTFPTPLPSTNPYAVTVQTQPAGQTCTVANGTGTVTSSNITNIQVTCSSAT